MSENRIEPTVPLGLGRCVNLRVLHLDCLEGGVGVGGPIPSELGNCVFLEHLTLSAMRIEGAVPPELGNCSALQHLRLGDNRLSGGLPETLGKLARLETLDVARNRLTGRLPAALGGAKPLRELVLRHNLFEGTVPESFAECYALDDILLEDSGLEPPLPDSVLQRAALGWSGMEGVAVSGLFPASGFLSRTDRSVFPMLVEMGAIEGEASPLVDYAKYTGRGRRPDPTPDTPVTLYVSDETFLSPELIAARPDV